MYRKPIFWTFPSLKVLRISLNMTENVNTRVSTAEGRYDYVWKGTLYVKVISHFFFFFFLYGDLSFSPQWLCLAMLYS